MKPGLIVPIAALLLQTFAKAQTLPSLQITNGNESVSLSWTGAAPGLFALQTTASLSRPVVWTDKQSLINNSGTATVDVGTPQQFFRLNPVTPLFQFAIFYDVNLEIDPGGATTFNAPVFCNQNIWEGSAICTFASTVTAVGTNSSQLSDPFASNYSGSGAPTYLLAGQPAADAPSLSIKGLGTNSSPAAMRSLLELPPAAYALGTSAAYSSNGAIYLANVCDLIITNFASGTNAGSLTPTGTNLAVLFQDQQMQTITLVPYDFFLIENPLTHVISTTNYVPSGSANIIIFAGYSWITNTTFRDWREGWNGGTGPPKNVQAVQIDVSKLNTWLTNTIAPVSGYLYDQTKLLHSGHHIDSIYVYTSVPLTGTQLPAVRLANGAQLPNPGGSANGLTVATPFPIYILGDYNSQNNGLSALGQWATNGATANTLPAALMGDAITILSDFWNDSNTSKMPTAARTTVNAAMLGGIVPSNPSISGNFSGGVENFIRLLESWGTATLTYNGSSVALFYSQYATNSWLQTGNYYNAPTRHYAFDLNFTNVTKLPPLTPMVENYLSP